MNEVPKVRSDTAGVAEPTTTRIWCGAEGWLFISEFIERTRRDAEAYAEAQPFRWRQSCKNFGLGWPRRARQ
jgi:hypothetical protein